jgi:hypothetical protein
MGPHGEYAAAKFHDSSRTYDAGLGTPQRPWVVWQLSQQTFPANVLSVCSVFSRR